PEHFIEQASCLCSELMLGWDPTANLNKIEDDITNADEGYSFVQYPDSGL
ncbi:hypothetical protein B0J15DRAFT_400859, partial [Fusarium solani]